MKRGLGELAHRPRDCGNAPAPPDCHLCGGALGGVRHGVENLSTVGALPQWYERCTNWEYGPLAKEDPPTCCSLCHCVTTQGPESKVIEEASPSPGGPTPVMELQLVVT